MANIDHYIKCNNCQCNIKLEDVSIEAKIVSKDAMVEIGGQEQKWVAVQYYFLCPACGTKYICFYKDRMVNEYFRLGKKQEAAKRMTQLFEVFKDVC